MTMPNPAGPPLDELRYALAEADAHRPPTGLRTRVLEAAEALRRPGIAVGTGPAISPAEAYRRTMASFDAVLSELTDEEWHRHVLRDLDIQRLVGHLIGVERQLQSELGIGPEVEAGDHVSSTQADAEAQEGRLPADTLIEWRRLTTATAAHVGALDDEARLRPITMPPFTVAVDRMLVVRSFETWTHEEDIRRVTGRPLAAPDPGRLRLMTEVAITALPAGLDLIDRPHPGRTARIVLTGAGGGAWQAALDRGEPGPTDVRIVADAASFCRLVANRLPTADIDADVTGDLALAADLLNGAQALALD